MLDNQLIRLINITSNNLDLAGSVIEKDYYVTRLIHALSNLENEYFKLIFAGGTCLAKAHKIVKRMSEDVDFKIQVKNTKSNFSRTRFLKELKQFRTQIISALALPDFTISATVARNEGQYLRIELNYPSSFTTNTTLRPHILLEFTLSDIRLAVENLAIKTLIEDTLESITLFEPPSTHCISVTETAIEKWVGLTRRIVAIERKYHADDPTLIRHVFDLYAIQQSGMITTDFFTLAEAIINDDAKQFKNQHPEYTADPLAEIHESLTILQNNPHWKTRYQDFLEAMVYDKAVAQNYSHAIQNLENISKNIIHSFKNQ